MRLAMMLLMVGLMKSRDILAQCEELLNQSLPEVKFLLQPDIPLKTVQFFLTSSPHFMSISYSPVFTFIIIIIHGFFIELFKVLQIHIQLHDFLDNGTVLFIENRNLFH